MRQALLHQTADQGSFAIVNMEVSHNPTMLTTDSLRHTLLNLVEDAFQPSQLSLDEMKDLQFPPFNGSQHPDDDLLLGSVVLSVVQDVAQPCDWGQSERAQYYDLPLLALSMGIVSASSSQPFRNTQFLLKCSCETVHTPSSSCSGDYLFADDNVVPKLRAPVSLLPSP